MKMKNQRDSGGEYDIAYWVYEMKMPEDMAIGIRIQAEKRHLTLDSYCTLVLMAGIEWLQKASDEEMENVRAACATVEETVQITCIYPVRAGQTEEEARVQYLAATGG